MRTLLAYLSIALFIGACGQQADDEAETTAAAPEPAVEPEPAAPPATSVYEDAVASSARLEGDSDRDATRKPAEVLEFFGIEPGDSVLEMWAGG